MSGNSFAERLTELSNCVEQLQNDLIAYELPTLPPTATAVDPDDAKRIVADDAGLFQRMMCDHVAACRADTAKLQLHTDSIEALAIDEATESDMPIAEEILSFRRRIGAWTRALRGNETKAVQVSVLCTCVCVRKLRLLGLYVRSVATGECCARRHPSNQPLLCLLLPCNRAPIHAKLVEWTTAIQRLETACEFVRRQLARDQRLGSGDTARGLALSRAARRRFDTLAVHLREEAVSCATAFDAFEAGLSSSRDGDGNDTSDGDEDSDDTDIATGHRHGSLDDAWNNRHDNQQLHHDNGAIAGSSVTGASGADADAAKKKKKHTIYWREYFVKMRDGALGSISRRTCRKARDLGIELDAHQATRDAAIDAVEDVANAAVRCLLAFVVNRGTEQGFSLNDDDDVENSQRTAPSATSAGAVSAKAPATNTTTTTTGDGGVGHVDGDATVLVATATLDMLVDRAKAMKFRTVDEHPLTKAAEAVEDYAWPVSYTHLTLPTIYSV